MPACLTFQDVLIDSQGNPIDLYPPVVVLDLMHGYVDCPGFILYTAAEATPVYTTEEVVEISSAVVLVWAMVWGIKVLRRAF